MSRNKKRRFGYIAFIFLFIAIIIISCWVGFAMFESYANVNTNEYTKKSSETFLVSVGFEKSKFGKFEENIENVEIKSTRHEHVIPADYITVNGKKDNNTVILIHGLGGDRTTMYPIAVFFLEQGYNVLTYDQRNSGDNMAKYTSYGYLESNDLSDCINYIDGQISEDKSLSVLGQSTGATTASIYACQPNSLDKVDLVMLDSPIVNIENIVRDSVEKLNLKLPDNYILLCGNWANKIKLGFFYGDVKMTNMMERCNVPTLIIHSKTDKVSSYDLANEIFEMIPHTSKKMCTLEDATHIMGFYQYNEEYESSLKSVLDSYAKVGGKNVIEEIEQ